MHIRPPDDGVLVELFPVVLYEEKEVWVLIFRLFARNRAISWNDLCSYIQYSRRRDAQGDMTLRGIPLHFKFISNVTTYFENMEQTSKLS